MTDLGVPPALTSSPVRRPRLTLWLLRGILGLHAALAVAQPVLAGSYLSGNVDAIAIHGPIGSALIPIGMLQFVIAVLFWWPGRGPWWPALVSAFLVVAEITQVTAGYARTLGLHIPLGVLITGSVVVLFGWSVRWRALPSVTSRGLPR